ncbi:MAG: hypothetical protein ACRDZP_02695 [Acidimicrobiales bacterium]
MHPIERLRWIARADGEAAATIASEAGWTLGELAVDEPAALLTACRRLVSRHPTCGPLWWVAAKLLDSDDPLACAQAAAAELYSDTVPDRLAEGLRASFTSGDSLAVSAPCDLVREALVRRSSYFVRMIADYARLRAELRGFGAVVEDACGFEPEEAEEALTGCSVLLVEALAAGRPGLVVDVATAGIVTAAAERCPPVPVWAVLGAGRVLPDRLVEAILDLAGAAGESAELASSDEFSLAVDAEGLGTLEAALARSSCPPGLELIPRGL